MMESYDFESSEVQLVSEVTDMVTLVCRNIQVEEPVLGNWFIAGPLV